MCSPHYHQHIDHSYLRTNIQHKHKQNKIAIVFVIITMAKCLAGATGLLPSKQVDKEITSALESIKFIVILLSYHGVMTQPSCSISNTR